MSSIPEQTSDEAATIPPELTVVQVMYGYLNAQLIYVATALGIADALRDEALTNDELARTVGAHPGALRRVLRGLIGLGFCTEDADGRLGLTRLGHCLRRDALFPLRNLILYTGALGYQSCGELLHSVRTGETAFEHRFGMELFPYLKEHPEHGEQFNELMTLLAMVIGAAVAETYDFSAAGTLVDIGGGHGMVIGAILEANPRLRGVLFDAPPVVAGAGTHLATTGVTDRCTTVGGDFFNAVPSGGDIYLLSRIIHDWDDERAIAILKNCRRAMNEQGRLLLVETIVPERMTPPAPPNDGPAGVPVLPSIVREDLFMLAMTGGLERTEAEYRALLVAAGFTVTRVLATPSPLPNLAGWSIIESIPASDMERGATR